MSQPVVLNDVTFPFSDSKHEMFVRVTQNIADGPKNRQYGHHLYTNVTLYVSGLKGQQVFSGSAIAVPDDWKNTAKSIKVGVQLALKRAVEDYLRTSLANGFEGYSTPFHLVYRGLGWYEKRRKEISSAFWKEFLNVTKLGEQ